MKQKQKIKTPQKVDLTDPKNWIDPQTNERYRYFTRQGHGYHDVLEWARDFEPPKTKDPAVLKKWNDEVRVVKQEYVLFGSFWISTVWLGLDHSFPYEGHEMPPLIFETMVFGRHKFEGIRFQKKQPYILLLIGFRPSYDEMRYTTEEEALAGHRELVKKWSNPLFVLWHFIYHEGIEDWYYDLKWKVRRLKDKFNKPKNEKNKS